MNGSFPHFPVSPFLISHFPFPISHFLVSPFSEHEGRNLAIGHLKTYLILSDEKDIGFLVMLRLVGSMTARLVAWLVFKSGSHI